ncbi:hypothetical protein EXU57_23400 [Segetibacter sp. 3557_3]|uniref:hypothetical protein n=1 Tax=Segetibacter sp. 3557_3 TaxID=2547429 RepID=UPI001058BADD|nr:hypothetical protein [Segetibacter sp. 3557_3]TDH18413.1 hypothetical protein EXU57_23400 [Segetibacter sp. 3557_3]
MKLFLFAVSIVLTRGVSAQTSKEIQGTWRMISSVITSPNRVTKMDSSTHNLTKQIGDSTFNFSLQGKATPGLVTSGQGLASTTVINTLKNLYRQQRELCLSSRWFSLTG